MAGRRTLWPSSTSATGTTPRTRARFRISTNSESSTFRKLAKLDPHFSIKKSSLSERLAKIPWQLFQELFEDLVPRALETIPVKERSSNAVVNQLLASAHILDSTVITLSAKLLKAGFCVNQGSLTVKASIAICGKQIPVKALVFREKTYASEDQALPKLIDFKKKNIIYIFDRGVQRLVTYAEIAKSGNFFISRLTAKNYQVKRKRKLPEVKETETLILLSDEIIAFPQFKDKKDQKFLKTYRKEFLVWGRKKEEKYRFQKNKLYFLNTLKFDLELFWE